MRRDIPFVRQKISSAASRYLGATLSSLLPYVFLACSFLPVAVHAQELDVSSAHKWLAEMRSAYGSFKQTNADGSADFGELYISRPGKARFDYDGSNGTTVIASDLEYVVFDPRSNDGPVSHSFQASPLLLLLESGAGIRGNPRVIGGWRDQGTLFIMFQSNNDVTFQGKLTLRFSNSPTQLLGWTTVDSLGQEIVIDLTRFVKVDSLDQSLFSVEAEIVRRRTR